MTKTEASLERLVGLAEKLCLSSENLDDLVIDLAVDMGSDDLNDLNGLEDCDDEDAEEVLTDWGEVASSVNNGGLESQLEFLLMGNSELQVSLLHQARAAHADADPS